MTKYILLSGEEAMGLILPSVVVAFLETKGLLLQGDIMRFPSVRGIMQFEVSHWWKQWSKEACGAYVSNSERDKVYCGLFLNKDPEYDGWVSTPISLGRERPWNPQELLSPCYARQTKTEKTGNVVIIQCFFLSCFYISARFLNAERSLKVEAGYF